MHSQKPLLKLKSIWEQASKKTSEDFWKSFIEQIGHIAPCDFIPLASWILTLTDSGQMPNDLLELLMKILSSNVLPEQEEEFLELLKKSHYTISVHQAQKTESSSYFRPCQTLIIATMIKHSHTTS